MEVVSLCPSLAPDKRDYFQNVIKERNQKRTGVYDLPPHLKAYMRSDEYKAMVKDAQLAATETFSKLLL
jgi:hypothetical protein